MRHDPIRFADAAPLGLSSDPLAVVTAMAARAPDDPLVQALLWKETAHAGREDRAARLLDASIRSLTGNAGALAALGHALLRMGGFDEAGRAFDAALALSPSDHEALLGRAALAAGIGDGHASDVLLRKAAASTPRIGPGSTLRIRSARGARLGVELSTVQGYRVIYGEAHLPVERFVDGPGALLLDDEAPLRACPPPGLLVNAIADPEDGAALGVLSRFLTTRPDTPVINRPEAIARIAPDRTARLSGGLPGVSLPETRRFTTGEDAVEALEAAFAYPFIARRVGAGGAVLVSDRDALCAFGEADLYVSSFEDTRDIEGTHRKARALLIDGRLYPIALLGSRDPIVRTRDRRRTMLWDRRLREEERDFIADPMALIGSRRWGAVRAVAAATGLDYVGVDFAPTEDGVVILKLCAAVGPERGDRNFPWLRPQADRITRAFREMVERRGSRSGLR